jgi:DNA-binding transcriptional ArsR family regulator
MVAARRASMKCQIPDRRPEIAKTRLQRVLCSSTLERVDLPELGPAQLKALTHPLRVGILRALRTDGPATATALGRRLGESSGATSYHLRQLARHGFVVEDTERGDGRERWWRAAFSGHRVDAAHFLDAPEHRAVLGMYEAQVVASLTDRAATFVAEMSAGEWSDEWAEAHDFSDFRVRLTPERLKRLSAKLHAVVESFAKYDTGEEVVVQVAAFPHRPRPFEEES